MTRGGWLTRRLAGFSKKKCRDVLRGAPPQTRESFRVAPCHARLKAQPDSPKARGVFHSLIALFLLLASPLPSHARELVVQSAFPKGMAALSESEQRITTGVEQLTDGALSLRFVGAGAIVTPDHLLDAVRDGTVPVAFDWMGFHGDRVPLAGFIASMPFGPTPRDLAGWIYGGGGMDMLSAAYDRQGIVALPCHMVLSEAGGWFNRRIDTPEDFHGLTMRIAGLGAEVLRRMGGHPSSEPPDHLFDALESGRLEAVEFSVPSTDQSFGFEHFTRYYYFPGWHQPSSLNVLLINQAVWDSLRESQRVAVRTTCRENVLWNLSASGAQQMNAIDAATQRGVQVRRFPESVLTRLRDVSRAVVTETAASDPILATAFASLAQHLDKTRRWDTLQTLPR